MSGAADGDEMVVMAAPARFVFGLLDKYLFSGEKMKTADAPSASTWWIDPVWVDQGPGDRFGTATRSHPHRHPGEKSNRLPPTTKP